MAIWDDPNILSGESQQITAGGIQPEVGLCMLHQGLVTMNWAIRFSEVRMFCPPHIYICNRNQPYDTAREQSTRAVMSRNVKWVFHLDSDVLPPQDVIPKMISYSEKFNLPLLSGVYWAKKPLEITGGIPTVAAWLKTGEHPEINKYDFAPVDVKSHINTGAILPVDVAGAGCMLVNADIFKRLDESNPKLPYFQWGLGRNYLCPKCGESGPLPMMSEDFYFMMRVQNELGIRAHLATSILCNHECNVVKRGTDGEFELTRM